MEILFDYYLKQDNMSRIMHTTVTEQDIITMLEEKFRNNELGCPIHFDREKTQIEFVIDKVTI